MTAELLDALKDALLLLPFLFLLYVLIELLEHRTAIGKPSRLLSGKLAPLIGGAAGLVPLCGFSVMASKLYEKRYLSLGTLFAVFIATSDEALLVLALDGSLPVLERVFTILALVGVKFVLAVGVGYLTDALFRRVSAPRALPALPLHEEEHEEHMREGADGENFTVCEHKHESKIALYLVSPLLHALEVAAAILLFNIAFAVLFYAVGEENVIAFLQGSALWYQPLVCALVGLIPNCASSVVLAEVYAAGGIGFSALLGGLVTNAGLGVLVLFRERSRWRRNLLILFATFALGVLFGYAACAIEILI